MTEAEWLTCTDPGPMLEFLERRGSRRKLQLFGVACCRRAWSLSTDARHRDAVEAAERSAVGELGQAEFEAAMQPVVDLWAKCSETEWGPFRFTTAATRHLEGGGATKYAANFAALGLARLQAEEDSPPWLAALQAEEAFQCSMLRDIFGDPSRPFRLDAGWLSGEGDHPVELARRIDAEGRFDDLPLLADALVRAGCRDRAVIDHSRAPGPHVRGCWVLDALLGREGAVYEGLVTEADWRAGEDPTSLLHFLRDKGTVRQWRLFAVACCKRIERFITDDRSRRAIETAQRHADGIASEEELEAAREAAEEALQEAKHAEWSAEAEEDFCTTPRYAAVSRSLFAASAARSAVCRDPRTTDDAPGTYDAERWRPSSDWAVAAAHHDVLSIPTSDEGFSKQGSEGSLLDSLVMTEHGKLSSGGPGPRVEEVAELVERAELRAQCEMLHDLFGEFLGPPGDEGDWIPCGGAAPVSEWWCRFPTRRSLVARPEWLEWSKGAIPKLAREIYDGEEFDRLPLLADALQEAGCHEPTILDHLRGGGPHWRGCWVLEALMDPSPSRPL